MRVKDAVKDGTHTMCTVQCISNHMYITLIAESLKRPRYLSFAIILMELKLKHNSQMVPVFPVLLAPRLIQGFPCVLGYQVFLLVQSFPSLHPHPTLLACPVCVCECVCVSVCVCVCVGGGGVQASHNS